MLQATSSQQEGTWSQGKFVQGTWMLQDGSNFKGDFYAEVNAFKHGKTEQPLGAALILTLMKAGILTRWGACPCCAV